MAEEGFFGFASRLASTFMGGAPDGPRYAWQAVAPWFTELSKSAAAQWLPRLVHGIRCEVVQIDPATRSAMPCEGSAIAGCEVCKKPCCLDHSFVQRQGAAVCYVCVMAAASERAPKIPGGSNWASGANPAGAPRSPPGGQAPRPSPPPPQVDPRAAHARKVLGIKKSATQNEIDARYKELLKKYHPDRHPADRAEAERKFKEVRVAYDFLKQAQAEAPR
jgi:hypothetical protein